MGFTDMIKLPILSITHEFIGNVVKSIHAIAYK